MKPSLVFREKKHKTKPGIVRDNCEMQRFYHRLESAALCFCLMMAATHLPTTHTAHTVQTTTFRMRSHLLSEKNGEGNKRKRKDYFGVVNGEKKATLGIMCMCAGLALWHRLVE